MGVNDNRSVRIVVGLAIVLATIVVQLAVVTLAVILFQARLG